MLILPEQVQEDEGNAKRIDRQKEYGNVLVDPVHSMRLSFSVIESKEAAISSFCLTATEQISGVDAIPPLPAPMLRCSVFPADGYQTNENCRKR